MKKTFIYLVGTPEDCAEFCKNTGVLNVPASSLSDLKKDKTNLVKLQMSLAASPVIAFSFDTRSRQDMRLIKKDAIKNRYDFKEVILKIE